MVLEKNMINILKTYLLKNNYPAKSIVVDFSFENIIFDLVVVDPVTNSPKKVYEFKNKISDKIVTSWRRFASTHPEIRFYIVTPITSRENRIRITYISPKSVQQDQEVILNTSRLMVHNLVKNTTKIESYDEALSTSQIQKKGTIVEQREKYREKVAIITILSSFILSIALIIDLSYTKIITTERLTAFLACVILMLVNYSRRISAFGVDLDLLEQKNNNTRS